MVSYKSKKLKKLKRIAFCGHPKSVDVEKVEMLENSATTPKKQASKIQKNRFESTPPNNTKPNDTERARGKSN